MASAEANTGEARQVEGLPDLDRLRGPNSTLQLVHLIEDFIRPFSSLYDAGGWSLKSLPRSIGILQRWAGSIDNEVTKSAIEAPPKLRSSLEYRVGRMIQDGVISDILGFSSGHPAVRDKHDKFYGKGRALLDYLGRPEQWITMKVLFDIGISGLHTWSWASRYERAGIGLYSYGTLPLEIIHRDMFGHIDNAAQRKGQRVEDITTPEQVRGIGYGPMETHIAPSVIDGVSVIIVTSHRGVFDTGTYGKAGDVDGYPNIEEIALKFTPSFLASVRPLTEEEYHKYVPKKEPEPEQKQQGGQRDNQQGQQREEKREKSGPNPGQRQRSESSRTRQDSIDPRDPQGYYKIFGINPDADPEDLDEIIRAAYRVLSRKYHPDTGGNTAANHQRMVAINLAYEFLSKPENRRNYGKR